MLRVAFPLRKATLRGTWLYTATVKMLCMQTSAFRESVTILIELATREPSAIMCADAVPSQCHRSLIADALPVRGCQVEEIVTAAQLTPLALHSRARVNGTDVTYPSAQDAQQSLDFGCV